MSDAIAYTGLFVIGDPHLEGRTPGFRKDDYPHVILDKLEWGLLYAQTHRLLPAILGDLFDKPRDNPTWMLGRLIDLLAGTECIGLYGNHDCADPELCDNDSLSLLVKAGRIRLLDGQPWRGTMNGRAVFVGGSSYRQQFPDRVEEPNGVDGRAPLVFWLAHHDIIVPGYEEQGRIQPREIVGIDLVINGHIHRHLQDVQTGRTLWMTPGNISRRSRSDATKDHIPSVLRIDVTNGGYTRQFVEVPHRPFDEVFHSILVDMATDGPASKFVAGLAELQGRRTESGAGLVAFLEKNLSQFEQPIAAEIMALAQEVTDNG
ncbi:MAG: metallophosphoesterase [Tepidisphaeraceae bacterium]|jgi:DNA repair exonuclease SbcCD nuclease subunit